MPSLKQLWLPMIAAAAIAAATVTTAQAQTSIRGMIVDIAAYATGDRQAMTVVGHHRRVGHDRMSSRNRVP